MNPDKLEIIRIMRFLFWGFLNTTISILVYALLVYFDMHIYIANLIAMIACVFLGHFFNKHKVFDSNNRQTLRKYFMLWTILYFISIGLITLFIDLGSNKYMAAVFAGGALIPVSYGLQKLLIFRDV